MILYKWGCNINVLIQAFMSLKVCLICFQRGTRHDKKIIPCLILEMVIEQNKYDAEI